jgi:peptide/nickel transport system permease protein
VTGDPVGALPAAVPRGRRWRPGGRLRAGAPALAAGIAALALLGPWLGPLVTGASPTEQVGLPFAAPSSAHPLGTDFLGRDALARLLDGGAVLVGLAVGATLVASVLGVLLGVLAATLPRRVGELVVRAVDVLGVVPALLVVLVLAAGFPGSDAAVLVAIALVSLPFSVRVNRAAVERVVGSGYVEVARARGDGWWRMLRHDVVPNIAGPALSEAGLRFVAALSLTATAGFLGLGRGAPAANWGRMVAENLPGARLAVWPFLAPALLLVLLAVAVNLVADGWAARVAGARA